MEDDKLKSLFSTFEPELSSDALFMTRLESNLNSVEIIKQHAAELRLRNKKAVAIAAFAGFVVGVIFSLALPYLSSVVTRWQQSLPDESLMQIFADNFSIIAWILIGGSAVFAALNTYEFSLAMFRGKEPR